MKKVIVLCSILFFAFSAVQAQKVGIEARLDSVAIPIGGQTRLSFEVNQLPEQQIAFPLFSDVIPGGLDIVEPLQVDTLPADDGRILVKHSYVVTAFQDSLMYIPPFPFAEGSDTLWSKSLSLKVIQPFELDMEANSITDIKPVFRPKFNWSGLFGIVLLVILIIGLGVGLYVLIRKYIQKKPVFDTRESEPELPAHVVALNELNRLKEEKLWQQDRLKEYYTQLTDIVRVYIDRTFEVNAMEMTSEEILDDLRYMRKDSKELYEKLRTMLQTSDLVKFAKWKPLSDESEQSLKDAFAFVEATKPKEEEKTEVENQNAEVETQNAEERI